MSTTQKNQDDAAPNRPTITVNGQGSVTVKPDTAQVTLGVQIQNADLAKAQSEAATRMNAVIDSLKQRGIDEAKIRTDRYYISVNRDPKRPERGIIGYTVMHMIEVKVTPLTNAGTVIEAVVAAGANEVRNIDFSVDNVGAALRQARQRAMDDAHNKAEQLAALGGVTLGKPISINEGVASSHTPMSTRYDASFMTFAEAAPPIQSGETEVTVQVVVCYGA